MKFFKAFFTFLFALSILAFFPIERGVVSKPQRSLSILSEDLFGALRPGDSRTFDRILAEKNPAWRDFRQGIEGEGLWTAGQIFSSFAWGYELGTGVNPAVILVTYGVAYDWALPPDGDLTSRVDAIRDALDQAYSAWHRSEVDRTRYPRIANGPTYALYRFFQGDSRKLEEWKDTFEAVFMLAPDQSLPKPQGMASIDDIAPFLQRPFDQLFGTNGFYYVSSFFDHHYPLYSDEPGDRTDLSRFDGLFFDDIPEPDACGTGGDTGSGTYCYSGHPAYDYPVAEGAPVKAAADGKMILCEPRWGALFIQHENGLITSYLHMDPLEIPGGVACADVAREQPQVVQGQVIGYVSNKNGYGDPDYPIHLHFGVGYEAEIRERQNIDPFGWWGNESDPWENYQLYPGQKSKWLWLGDERNDGLLTVDNSETQAQLFNAPQSLGDWNWVDQGYPEPEGDAWYAHLSYRPSRTAVYWGIWGVNIERPGIYQIQAYWPSDPEPDTDPEPAKKVKYTLYYHDTRGQIRSVPLYADQSRNAGRFVTLCAVPYGDNAEGCPDIPQIQFGVGPSVVILRDVSDEPVERGKYMVFFDAIRWKPVLSPTPTPTSTPTPTPTPTFTPTPSGTVTVRVQIASGPEDAGPEPTACDYATTWNEVYFGECRDGTPITSGFRFGGVPVPQGAQIVDAYIEFTVDGPYDVPVEVRIYGEASGNAEPFSGSDRPEDRRRTRRGAVWRIPDTDHWELGETRRTPGLARVVQEIVSRPDWQPYHGMGFIFKTVSSASGQHRRVIGYERPVWFPGRENAARLVIQYIGTVPPTPMPTATPGPCVLEGIQSQSSALQDLGLFYGVRSKLGQTAEGRRYVEMYYEYSPSLLRLVESDAEVRGELVEVLRLWRPVLEAWVRGGEASLTPAEVKALRKLAVMVAERGEPGLREAARREMESVPWDILSGMEVNEAADILLGNGGESWGTPVPTGTQRP